MSVWIILSLALSLVVGFFVSAPLVDPLLEGANESLEAESYATLKDSKERALRALKDLELDYTMGKVGREDFERSKQELSLEVAKILEEMRRHG